MAQMTRRDTLTAAGAVLAGATRASAAAPKAKRIIQKGRLKQSVCRWCYEKIPLPEFCKAVAGMGLTAIDLVDEKDWGVLADHGLHCSMAWNTSPGGIPNGLNDPANHDEIVGGIIDAMPRAKKAGVPNIIAFFGNRKGISDDDAIKNCVIGLNRVKKAAEEHELTICVELLNSKIDHKDYQGDRTWFGVEVVKRVESPRVKLLYDIYHMQIMEGDVIATIRRHHPYFAHYHTAGVPGRHELDENQELYYPAIVRAIMDTGYQGYLGQEFVPRGPDPLAALRAGVEICDV